MNIQYRWAVQGYRTERRRFEAENAAWLDDEDAWDVRALFGEFPVVYVLFIFRCSKLIVSRLVIVLERYGDQFVGPAQRPRLWSLWEAAIAAVLRNREYPD